MSNAITLDHIINASRKSGVSIADIIKAIDSGTVQTKPAPKVKAIAAKKAAVKSAATMPKRNAERDATMANKDASESQMRRINATHVKLGLRPYGSLSTFRAIYPTMLAASLYYGELTA